MFQAQSFRSTESSKRRAAFDELALATERQQCWRNRPRWATTDRGTKRQRLGRYRLIFSALKADDPRMILLFGGRRIQLVSPNG